MLLLLQLFTILVEGAQVHSLPSRMVGPLGTNPRHGAVLRSSVVPFRPERVRRTSADGGDERPIAEFIRKPIGAFTLANRIISGYPSW